MKTVTEFQLELAKFSLLGAPTSTGRRDAGDAKETSWFMNGPTFPWLYTRFWSLLSQGGAPRWGNEKAKQKDIYHYLYVNCNFYF
jgi:hypothetical protein